MNESYKIVLCENDKIVSYKSSFFYDSNQLIPGTYWFASIFHNQLCRHTTKSCDCRESALALALQWIVESNIVAS